MITVKHLITSYDVLPNGSLKPSAMLKYMQDAATIDAANYGADYISMREKDMIFVVSKAIVSFSRTPMVDEELEIRTWNSGTQGVSFVRNYVITVNGETVGTGTTRWVLVSYSSRRILRPDALFTDVTTNAEEQVGIEPTRRIKLSEDITPTKDTYIARLTDMDTNSHVNNTRYGDLLVDFCGIDFIDKKVSEFEIHFVSELTAGESVEISAAADGSGSCLTAVKADGQQVFSARVVIGE